MVLPMPYLYSKVSLCLMPFAALMWQEGNAFYRYIFPCLLVAQRCDRSSSITAPKSRSSSTHYSWTWSCPHDQGEVLLRCSQPFKGRKRCRGPDRGVQTAWRERCSGIYVSAELLRFALITALKLGPERFRAPEILFNPELIGQEYAGVHQVVVDSIDRVDLDLRKSLFSNIVLSGGSTLCKGSQLTCFDFFFV